MKKNSSLLLCSFISLTLMGCNEVIDSTSSDVFVPSDEVSDSSIIDSSFSIEDSSIEISSEEKESSLDNSQDSSEDTYLVDETFDFEGYGFKQASVKQVSKLDTFAPTTFKESTYKKNVVNLADGVDLVEVSYELNNGSLVSPKCVVVDLTKANIVAGTTNNNNKASEFAKKATPFAQAKAWLEDNPGKEFYAVTNADFFGSSCINAFVKDGVILKNSHNYDLNDVPASKPMLFGVCDKGAQIAPITNFESYNDNLASVLYNKGLTFYDNEGNQIETVQFGTSGLIKSGISLITETAKTGKRVNASCKVYKFVKIQQEKWEEDEVRGCIVEEVTGISKVTIEDDSYGYVVVGKETELAIGVGSYLALAQKTVISPDGLWNSYDTIIGARHSLVENGKIAPTLSKEDSNGALARVPRTSIGVMDDGKVVIVSVEDLHYNKNNGVSTCTGLTLIQLADFMRYFGCFDAANFDGGGSSQLVVKENGSYVVKTRSSDTGSTEVTSTRSVINSIIVTSK